MRTYVVAMTKKRKKRAKITSTKREQHVVEEEQQKILTKIKRKKTLMIKINSEKKKTIIKNMSIKNLMQKVIIMKKRKKDVLSIRRLLNENLKLLASFEETRTRMKKNLALMNDITLFATTVKCTYVVLTHDMRLSNVNTLNQQKAIRNIIKQNNILHKDLNIVRVI
jgi:D-arabinose 1-dehydrogenase-like Zn-dependent alcohol dehydrogenase